MQWNLFVMLYVLHHKYGLPGGVTSHQWLVVWLCLTSHRQRGHSETAPPFTVPCEGREAR